MIAGWIAVALAGVHFEAPPAAGVETIVAVTDAADQPAPGETVRVVHRPGLTGEEDLAIGITDGRGRVRWTPTQGGIAVVRAGDERLPVEVAGGVGAAAAPWLALFVAGGGLIGVGWRRRR